MKYTVRLICILCLAAALQYCSEPPTSDETVETTVTANDSLELLNRVLASTPNDADALYRRARYFYNQGNYGDAIFDLAAAMKIDSINESYHLLLADSYLGTLKSEFALITMERALRLFPESPRTLLKAAELQIILKQYNAASVSLAKVLTLDPQNTQTYYLLGVMYHEQGRPDRAIQSFQKVVELDSENKEAWTMLGNLYDIQDSELALQCFENAIAIDPGYAPAWHSKAFYLQNHDRTPEAIEIYRNLHTIDSTYADAYLNAGILYIEEGELDLAEAEFTTLNRISPTSGITVYYLGVIAEQKGELEKALGYYNQATALSPRSARFAEAVEQVRIKLGE